MQVYLFIAALIAVLAVIFALQNAVPITVSFLMWKVESSLALILIIAFIAGLIVSFMFNTLTKFRRTRVDSSQKQKKEIEEIKEDTTNDTEQKRE